MALSIYSANISRGESLRLLKRILKYFKQYKLQIFLACFSMVLVALTSAGTAYLVKPALDDIFVKKDVSMLLLLPFAFVLLTLVKGLGRYFQNYFMQYCGLLVLETLRDELYNKIVFLPVKFFEDNQIGMLMSRITNDVGNIRSSLPALVSMVREFMTMLGLLVVVFYQNWSLALWAVLVLPLGVYPFIYLGKKLRKLGKKSQITMADVTSFLQEVFSGIRVVKAFAAEDYEAKRFAVENRRMVKIAFKQTIINEISSPLMELVGAVGIGLVMWYGGKQVIDGVSTPGTFFSFLAALVMLYDPLKKLTTSNNDVQRALASAERVFEILDSEEIREEDDGAIEFTPPLTEMHFEHVTFRYSKHADLALDDVCFTIRAGERVAIVGPSGAGKSTFVNLIPRFYDPQSGEIRLNGRNIREYTLRSLRESVALVSQDTFLFNTSIAQNIAYGVKDYNLADVQAAAQKAYAHDFIMAMPEGYDSIAGERGVKMSGGQKQRLAIARAIYKDMPLLILDEATSALDSESERIVQMALENLMRDRTSIVIAHRLSTVLNADRILVMEQGRIVAVGKHDELLSGNELYQKLYNLQFNTDAAEEGDADA